MDSNVWRMSPTSLAGRVGSEASDRMSVTFSNRRRRVANETIFRSFIAYGFVIHYWFNWEHVRPIRIPHGRWSSSSFHLFIFFSLVVVFYSFVFVFVPATCSLLRLINECVRYDLIGSLVVGTHRGNKCGDLLIDLVITCSAVNWNSSLILPKI